MKQFYVILDPVILVGATAAIIIPMWVAAAGMDMAPTGWGVVATIFCFAVGGAFLFPFHFNARRRYNVGPKRGRDYRESTPPGPAPTTSAAPATLGAGGGVGGENQTRRDWLDVICESGLVAAGALATLGLVESWL